MDISHIIEAANPAAAKSKTDGTSLGKNFNAFLNLLTAQLKNQDPLSPMDSSEFTNQLVQFANVEQSIKSNDYLQKLLTLNAISMTGIGLSYIGLDVFAPGVDFAFDGKNPVSLSYKMPENAEKGTIAIVNEDGDTVFSTQADTKAGLHSLSWNGKDTEGNLVPKGNYTIKISGQTTAGKALSVITYTPGVVTGIETGEDGSVSAIINGKLVPVTEIRHASIRTYVKPPEETPTDGDSDSDTDDEDTSGTNIAS